MVLSEQNWNALIRNLKVTQFVRKVKVKFQVVRLNFFLVIFRDQQYNLYYLLMLSSLFKFK